MEPLRQLPSSSTGSRPLRNGQPSKLCLQAAFFSSLLRCRWINGCNRAVHLPGPIWLPLKNTHQFSARTDRLATRARTQTVGVSPPFEGIVAENLDFLNVEPRVEDLDRTRRPAERFRNRTAPTQYGPRRLKQHVVIRPLRHHPGRVIGERELHILLVDRLD